MNFSQVMTPQIRTGGLGALETIPVSNMSTNRALVGYQRKNNIYLSVTESKRKAMEKCLKQIRINVSDQALTLRFKE